MITSVFAAMVPILLAALGGTLTERAGVLNIGLEGLILTGAFFGIVGVSLSGSITMGLLAGSAAGLVAALVYSVACIELRANIFVAGLATNLLAAGGIPYLSELLFATKGVIRMGRDPLLLRVAGVPVSALAAVAVAAVLAAVLFHTPFGIRLRAVGGNPSAVEARGLSPQRYRRAAMLISGALGGLAGAEIATRLGVYLPNISGGRGWIALVAIFLGARHPLGVVAAAFFFALSETVAGAAQGFTSIPGTLLLGVPYLVTLVAMVVYSILGRRTGIQGEPAPNE